MSKAWEFSWVSSRHLSRRVLIPIDIGSIPEPEPDRIVASATWRQSTMVSRPATPAQAARIACSSPRAGDPIPGHIGTGGRDDATLIAAVATGDAAALDQL